MIKFLVYLNRRVFIMSVPNFRTFALVKESLELDILLRTCLIVLMEKQEELTLNVVVYYEF